MAHNRCIIIIIIISVFCNTYEVLVFPIVLYGAETWTMRKHERRKIDAFELWCWRRVLRVSWMESTTNISIIESIKPEWQGSNLSRSRRPGARKNKVRDSKIYCQLARAGTWKCGNILNNLQSLRPPETNDVLGCDS